MPPGTFCACSCEGAELHCSFSVRAAAIKFIGIRAVSLTSVTEGIPQGSEARRGRFARGAWLPLTLSVIGLGAWLAFRWGTGLTLDDALITYRYAENLAEGHGFVFNEGERVLGTTTPLLTLLLALGGLVFGVEHIPLCSNCLMISAALGAGLLMYGMLRHAGVGSICAAAAILLFYIHPDVVWSTTGGWARSSTRAWLTCTASGRNIRATNGRARANRGAA